jgi:hypothetical protein
MFVEQPLCNPAPGGQSKAANASVIECPIGNALTIVTIRTRLPHTAAGPDDRERHTTSGAGTSSASKNNT